MILIASSFSLLVIVAGMFLLAKTQKDGLSNFFKYISYFVIILGFLNLFCGGVHMFMKHCSQHCNSEMKHCKKSKHAKHSKIKIYRNVSCGNEIIDEENCMMHGDKTSMNKEKSIEMEMGAECTNMKEKSCCKDKMMMKKDTMIIKKR
jgi:ABC-type nickel/cobalt efflux system permease component RcnA